MFCPSQTFNVCHNVSNAFWAFSVQNLDKTYATLVIICPCDLSLTASGASDFPAACLERPLPSPLPSPRPLDRARGAVLLPWVEGMVRPDQAYRPHCRLI